MTRKQTFLYCLIIVVGFAIAVNSVFTVMAGKLALAGFIAVATYIAAFTTALAVIAIKAREGGAQLYRAGAESKDVRAYYRSILLPTVWMVFLAALIAGTILSPLAILVFGPSF